MIYYKKLILSICLGILLFALLDYIVLGFLLKKIWNNQIQLIQHSPLTIRLSSAILCYILMVWAIYQFVIKPNHPWYYAALLGLVMYGVFDLTNLSIFKDYKWSVALLDVLWGMTATTLVSYIMIKIIKS